ncbi:hypothetical protein GCM10010464_00740 [Pseudonocardia yunnanensis]|uniref:DUF418 domain-containing protein n=1 Tax=Pseudonocardia yunnanensis TaxID=58107 RepID=A0ABW4FAA3_9PSEU
MSDGEPEAGACASVRGPRTGVDLARGLALLGLMAAGVFHAAPGNGPSALGPMSAGDCPAVAFALVAGVSLALTSGGCRIPDRRHRASARAGVAVQAVLIAAIGLALGFSDAVPVVLPYYGVLFLLATLFLGRRPWFLARFAAVVLLVTPIMVTSTLDSGVPQPQGNPTFSTVVADPSGLLIDVFVTGLYPVLVYLASICAGLAIGRMDLSSVELTRGLLIGGLAVVAVSWVWWLAFPASRSHGWVYLIRSINSLGSAVVVVVAALLLVRTRATERLLRPFTAVGTMVLTLYCGYVVVVATGVLGSSPAEQYPVLLAGALLFAVLWRRFLAEGPLEFLVAQLARRARHAVLAAGTEEPE